MQRVLPHPTVKNRMSALAVGLAVHWETPEPAIAELFAKHLPDAESYPMVGFLAADGTWIDGYWGRLEAPEFLKVVTKAEASPLLLAAPEVRKALEKPAALATAAAAKGDWKTVLASAREAKKSTGRCPERTAIAEAEKKARDHAATEFAAIVQAAAGGGDIAALRKRLAALKPPFAGEPEAADCDTGLKALQRLQVVREVEAGGNPAKDLRPRSAEPFQGTRWTALFDKPAAPAGK